MWREDYSGADYAPAEWRHVICLHGCTNVQITGLTLAESGGDGIYVGAGGGPCVDVRIRDVVCDRNHRQGISVISAENLLIENCILKNTGGTAPMAGIDFEPNRPTERLVNCVMRGCTVENNRGHAYLFALHQLNGTSPPISIRLEDCASAGTNRASVAIHTRNGGAEGAVRGEIGFTNCRFEDAGANGIEIASKPASGARVRFDRGRIADPAEAPGASAPIRFTSRPGDTEPVGGVEFADTILRVAPDRPPMQYQDRFGAGIAEITGRLIIERGKERDAATIDRAFLAAVLPTASLDVIAPFPMAGVRLEPLAPSAGGATPPTHKLRGEAMLLLHAKQGDAVALRLHCRPVTSKGAPNPMPVHIAGPSGAAIMTLKAQPGQDVPCEFTAPETGVFRVHCEPGRDWMRVVSSSHPVCVSGAERPVHFIGTSCDLFFLAPAGTKEFAMRICGDNDGERVKASVFDASGNKVWDEDSISAMRSYAGKPADPSRDEVWRLRVEKPSQGVLEDFHVDLRGIPPLLAFRREDLLRPAR